MLKVFLLAGQSNMEGQAVVDLDHEDHYNGGRGILTRVLEDPGIAREFGHWRGADGSWTKRNDVFVWYQPARGPLKAGPLSIGYAGYEDLHHFGPEMELGWELAIFVKFARGLIIVVGKILVEEDAAFDFGTWLGIEDICKVHAGSHKCRRENLGGGRRGIRFWNLPGS